MYDNIAEIKTANRELGHHWFDSDTLLHFGTRVVSDIIGGRFFVVRESPPAHVPIFRVIRAEDDGQVQAVRSGGTVTDRILAGWGWYNEQREALAAAKECVRNE